MQEGISEAAPEKRRSSVSFSKDITVFDVPCLSDELVDTLFYTKDEITTMKNEALMEKAGVIDWIFYSSTIFVISHDPGIATITT